MPHEVDMTKALIMSLKEWRTVQTEDCRVTRVNLLVGKFTCVEPDLLRTAFARQRMGTFLEHADLAIRESEFIAYCEPCNAEYKPDIAIEYACPSCKAALGVIRSGRELKIENIETSAEMPSELVGSKS